MRGKDVESDQEPVAQSHDRQKSAHGRPVHQEPDVEEEEGGVAWLTPLYMGLGCQVRQDAGRGSRSRRGGGAQDQDSESPQEPNF